MGGGTPNYGLSAGVLTLRDVTSNATIGVFDFGGQGYENFPTNSYTTLWRPGDTLTVSAAGDQVGAFTTSAPALSAPTMQFPASIIPTKDLSITWRPDPNADTMWVQLLDDDAGSVEIVCSVPDSNGAVTVDASLLAAFRSGDICEGSADRETDRLAQTSNGHVTLLSFGYSVTSTLKVD